MIGVIIQWVANILTVSGVWILAKKDRSALLLLVVGNLLWMCYAISVHMWALVTINLVMTILDVRAWYKWGSESKRSKIGFTD